MRPHTFLRTQIRNVLRKWYQNQGSTVFILTSQKTEIAKYACEPRWQSLFAEDVLAKQYPIWKVWWLDDSRSQSLQWGGWISKQSLIRSRDTRSSHSMANTIRAKQRTSQEKEKSLGKFLEPSHKPKDIYTDNSLEFRKYCEDLSWNHRTSTSHRSETDGIAGRAVRRVKEGTSAVLLQSGLDERWWADSMECYCYLRNFQDLLADGKSPHESRFGEPFKGPILLFGAMVENHHISTGDPSRLHRFGKKAVHVSFLGVNWSLREFGMETFRWRTWKIWKSWMHQKFILEESTRKKYW